MRPIRPHSSPVAPVPRRSTPLQPQKGFTPPPKKRDGGGGVGRFLKLFVLLAAGGFGYAMYHFDESPQQVWKRITDRIGSPASVPAPTPTPTPVPAPTPAPTAPPQPTPEAAATPGLRRSVAAAGPRFVHPGIPLTREDLAELKRNINREPWKSGFNALQNDWRSKLDYKMRGPFEVVSRNPHNRRNEWMVDMQAAWNLARMWVFTDDEAYAKKSRDILIAWATTQKEFNGMESNLDLGDYAFRWGGAASILRGTWPGWTAADTAAVKKLFGEVYWPSTGGWKKMPGPTNKGSLSLAAATAIAVFCDDKEKLQHVLELLRTAPSTGFANTLPNGEHGESGRDQGHSYGHLLAMSFTAEVLWKQGIDVFSERENRLLAMGEYYGRLNVGVATPFVPMGTTDEYYHSIWDKPGFAAEPTALSILRGAYVVRKGLSAPYLEQKLASQGTNMESFMFYKTSDNSQAAPLQPAVFPDVSPVGADGLKSVDIGDIPDGRTDYADGVWTVTGGGQEIWGHGAGSCRFVFKRVKGDCTIVARVDSLGKGGQPNAKAGVMIRSDTEPAPAGAAWIALTAGGKIESFFHGWAEMYGGSNWEAQVYGCPPPPWWLKVERRGDVVTTYASPDGVSWATIIASTYSNLGESPCIGLVVCAFSKDKPLSATFSRVSVTGGGGGKVFAPAAPLAIYASPGSNQVPLRWLESFGAESYNVKRSTTKGGPYRTIANVKGTSHVDAAASRGETYYYVVSAANSAGESPNSPEDPVKPADK
jgi:regulation of enolase protein 1 (concanavalin A-like superfamily)